MTKPERHKAPFPATLREKEKTKKIYHRLPGRKRGAVNVQTLWMAEDHLLLVDTALVHETYKRLYFKDIQAIILQENNRFVVSTVVHGLLILLFAVLIVRSQAPPAQFFLGLILALFFYHLVKNFTNGQTCDCYIRTAVQTQKLGTLTRFKSARKVLDRVLPKIEAAQGKLTPEMTARPVPERRIDAISPEKRSKPATRRESGRFHAALFGTLLFSALVTPIDMAVEHVAASALPTLALIAGFVFMAIALGRQADSDLPAKLQRLTWIIFGYSVFCILIGGTLPFYANPEALMIGGDQNDSPSGIALSAFSVIGDVTLGLTGFRFLREMPRER